METEEEDSIFKVYLYGGSRWNERKRKEGEKKGFQRKDKRREGKKETRLKGKGRKEQRKKEKE
jgi:hypothetical protein